jgi:hypothetical protein
MSPPKKQLLCGKKRKAKETTVEIHQRRIDTIKRIESEKEIGNYPFKNQAYLKKRGKINAKAIKNLKQLTLGIENGDTLTPGSYYSIESAPSIKPSKKYCDFTGLPSKYSDHKTGVQYHDADFFKLIQILSDSAKNEYLQIRNAVTFLK